MDPNYKGPFDEDVLENSSAKSKVPLQEEKPVEPPPLMEKDFIHEPREPGAVFPLWLWIFLATAAIAVVWGSMGWYQQKIDQNKSREPFLEVTNREMSVFLWQFPSFIRSNVSKKAGYLPGFMTDREAVDPAMVDQWVTAPPELLFLYHLWNRLLAPDFISRPITPVEFTEFLAKEEIWQPANWKKAPKGYVDLINSKGYEKTEDLESLSKETLPLIVRLAFQGWKNYYSEGKEINAVSPTVAQVEAFLLLHPTYSRNYWRNIDTIVDQKIAGLNYLEILHKGVKAPDVKIPADQLSPFLKVSLYNFEQITEKK